MPINTLLELFFLRISAIFLLLIGRKKDALNRFESMLTIEPLHRYAMASRAHLLGDLGDKKSAVIALNRLAIAYPDFCAHWFNLGFVQQELGSHAEAENAFRKALSLDPKMDRAWYGLALALISEHRFEEAVEALKRNTELQPMSPFGWYQLARVHVDRQEPEEAAKIIRHLRGFEPKVAAQLERETGLMGT